MSPGIDQYTDIVHQRLQHVSEIQTIRDTLSQVHGMGTTSHTLFSALAFPIFSHALKFGNMAENVDNYAQALHEVYIYSKGDLLDQEERVFFECVALVEDTIIIFGQEESIDTDKYPFELHLLDDVILLQLLSVAVQACFLMMKSIKNPGYNQNVLALWRSLPFIFDSCLLVSDHPSYKIKTIEAATDICDSCLGLSPITLYNNDIEELIDNMLDLLDQKSIPLETFARLSITLSFVVEQNPNLKLMFPEAMLNVTYSVIDTYSNRYNKQFGYNESRAILNISCLLLKNYASAPWLDEIFSTMIDNENEELDILKLKLKLLQEFVKNISLPSSQVEVMDIDQVSQREMHQDFKSVVKSTSINKKIIDVAGPIITELTNLDSGDVRSQLLIKKLKNISIYTDNTAISVICQAQLKELVEYATKMLTIDPNITECIAALFGFSIPLFILHHVQYALPYAIIYTTNSDTLGAITASLETSAREICQNSACHILMAIYLEQDTALKSQGMAKLKQIFGDKKAFVTLTRANMTNLTTRFTMNLGQPKLKDASFRALLDVKKTLGSEALPFPQFMSQQVISILSLVTKFITQKRNNSVEIDDPFALDALKELMRLLENSINDHTPHLMTIFQNVSDLPDMQLEALALWKTFITVLDDRGLVIYLNGIIHGLLNILTNCDHHVRTSVAQVVEDVLIGRSSVTSPLYPDMPALPDFEELKNAKEHVEASLASMQRNMKASSRLDHQLNTIIKELNEGNDIYILIKLKRLKIFLGDHPKHPLPYNLLYSKLLYLIRKYAGHKEISRYAAVCLGQIGAMNPSLVSVDISDDQVVVMENFGSASENRRFICGLISNHLYPAYNATADEDIHLSMHATVQSLLKCANFEAVHVMTRKNDNTYQSWKNLSTSVQEFLMPFLQTDYQHEMKVNTIEFPIFTRVESFHVWVQEWYCKMVNVAKTGTAKMIFTACLPVVMSENVDVATFLIPYLVLFSIFSGTNDHIRNIAAEINDVLDTFATPDDVSQRGKMNYQSLQLVVSVSEYLRQWMNSVKVGDRKKSAEIERVSRFLQMIPDRTMGIAAFNSKAYPQALMHFESHMKTFTPGTFDDVEILQYLRQIYTQLEDTVDLMALLDIYSAILSHDEEIIRFEVAGKWQEAEVMYKSRVSQTPHELSSYTDYLNYLKRWGSYENALYFANKTIINHPQWVSPINVFKIDSAWRLEDWYTLEEAVKAPTQKTPEALIGRILSQLRKNNNLGALCSVEETRDFLIERLTSSTKESYRKSYPTILNLQILQDMEDAQSAWEAPNQVQRIQELESKWSDNFQNISSSYHYKHNVLELRKAVLCDIRLQSIAVSQASNLWLQIAKLSRKNGNLTASFDAILQAEKLGNVNILNEKAKWYWAAGDYDVAISLLWSCGSPKSMRPNDAMLMAKFLLKPENQAYRGVKVRDFLAEAIKTADKMEKANHMTALYYRKHFSSDTDDTKTKLKALLYMVKTFSKALTFGSKYYYSSMSQMINAWFELTGLATAQQGTKLAEEAMAAASKANEHMSKILSTVPPFQFIFFLTRLISHLSIADDDIAKSLMAIIGGVFETYPRSMIWFLLGALESPAVKIAKRVDRILKVAQANDTQTVIMTVIRQGYELIDALKTLAGTKLEPPGADMRTISALQSLFKSSNLEIHIPTEASLYPILPEVITDNHPSGFFPSNLPLINRVGNECFVMKSLQKPKKIILHGSDGKDYGFLVKSNDDLRKDARTMEFNYMINSLLKKNPESRDNELYIRTYAVLPMGNLWGLIQWIDNIKPLKGIVNDLWVAQNSQSVSEITIMMNRSGGLSLEKEKIAYYKQKLLPLCKPVFHKWFLKQFPEANQWLSSRTRYTKTLAVMSIVGHVLGLGDRHAENVLFDETNGDCVHVDLNMLFDQGEFLNTPEVVPFRLTPNLIDAMGATGYTGNFTKTCETTMKVLHLNKDALVGVFQTLSNDKFSERIYSKGKALDGENAYMVKLQEKFVVEKGSTVNVRVKELIEQACSVDNLARMFPGWAPFC